LGGFNIAMKDLEIRGAGDLLGERAKWFHQWNRFWYQKNHELMNWKMNLRIYIEESNIETKEYVKDLQIDTDFAVFGWVHQ
jgi:transcription-repair coupling factor (superfamily II helicase)